METVHQHVQEVLTLADRLVERMAAGATLVDDQYGAGLVELDLRHAAGACPERLNGAGNRRQSSAIVQSEARDGIRAGIHDVNDVMVQRDARGMCAAGGGGSEQVQ